MVFVTETGITTLVGKKVEFTTTLTENALMDGWSVTESSYYDPANTPFKLTTLIGTKAFSGAKAATFSDDKKIDLTNVKMYSLTEVYSLTLGNLGAKPLLGQDLSTISITVEQVAQIPETSTWTMMGLGFLGLGLAGWRHKNRASRAVV
jgi:hypothetical protein